MSRGRVLVAACFALLMIACAENEGPVDPWVEARVEPLCQLGCQEQDPNPSAAGVFLGSGATAESCFSGAQNDLDADGVGDVS
jgi:hypothetical protein